MTVVVVIVEPVVVNVTIPALRVPLPLMAAVPFVELTLQIAMIKVPGLLIVTAVAVPD